MKVILSKGRAKEYSKSLEEKYEWNPRYFNRERFGRVVRSGK